MLTPVEPAPTESVQPELALLPAQLDPGNALPPVLTLRLFGAMHGIDATGRAVLPRTRRTRALLAVLAMHAPRPVLRTQLIALFWSRREREQARASLRQALHELQAVLGPEPARLLRVGRHELALDDRGLWTDVAALVAWTTPADALAAFAPPLLGDLAGIDPSLDAWIAAEQRRLAALARRRAMAALETGVGAEAVLLAAERLSALDPTDAAAWDLLAKARRLRGDRDGAEMAAAQCAALLGAAVPALSDMPPAPAPPAPAPPAAAPPAPAPPGADSAPSGRIPWFGTASARSPRVGVVGLRPLPGSGTDAEMLAAGLSEELIAALARFRGISCIPLWTRVGPPVAVPAEQPAPPIDFLLDGAVQAAGAQLRVRVRLLDISGGGDVVWSVRFDRALGNLFALQDELAGETVARLESHLLVWQERRARGPAHPGAERLLRAALPGLLRLDRAAFASAGKLLESARGLDPDHAGVHAWLAHWHLFAVGQGWAEHPAAAGHAVRAHADAAVALDPEDARALSIAAHVRGFVDRDPAAAEPLHARAMAANPNLPLGWSLSGLNQAYLGHHAEAAHRAATAMRLSPQDPLRYFFDIALAVPLFLSGDDTASIRIGRESIAASPGFSSAYKTQLAALGQLGRREEAADIRTRLLALEPGFTVAEALERSPIHDPAGRARYAEGLRLGGLE